MDSLKHRAMGTLNTWRLSAFPGFRRFAASYRRTGLQLKSSAATSDFI
jgi:hypothetical protein